MATAKQTQFQADDEDDLFSLQQQMKSSCSKPSATAIRINKSQTNNADTEPTIRQPAYPVPVENNDQSTHIATPETPLVQQEVSNIIGDVTERTAGDIPPPNSQLLVEHASNMFPDQHIDGFPKPVHRKLSKFSLARRKTRASVESNEITPAIPAAGVMQEPSEQAHHAMYGSHITTTEAAIDSIQSQDNASVLANMTEEEIAAAREEILSRFSTKTVEFLKQRGLGKKRENANAHANAHGEQQKKEPDHEADADNGHWYNKYTRKTSNNNHYHTYTPTETRTVVDAAGGKNNPTAAASIQEQKTSASSEGGSSPVALLRFNLDGDAMGCYGPGGTVQTADVVRRDPIRYATYNKEQQSSSSGYTIQEACMLTRSTVPQQRILALRLLTSVLVKARTAVAVPLLPYWVDDAIDSNGSTASSRPASIAPLISVKASARDGDGVVVDQSVTWVDVWHHALHAGNIVTVLRTALDDSQGQVVAAASKAIAALLCPSYFELVAMEACDANPVSGWPSCPSRHMQRQNASAPWMCSSLDIHQRDIFETKMAAESSDGAVHDSFDDKDDKDDETLLAKVDPFGGIMNMRLVPRILYVLHNMQIQEAVIPLLHALLGIALGGDDAISMLLTADWCVVDVLQEIMGQHPENEKKDVLVVAVRLLRALCQGSQSAAQRIVDSGIFPRYIAPIIVQYRQATPVHIAATNATASVASLSEISNLTNAPALAMHVSRISCSLFVESIRLWRCVLMHGLCLPITIDDAYPALCHHVHPQNVSFVIQNIGCQPPGYTTSDTAGGDCIIGGAGVKQWIIAREIYLLLAQVCSTNIAQSIVHGSEGEERGNNVVMSVRCASALASQAQYVVTTLPGSLGDALKRRHHPDVTTEDDLKEAGIEGKASIGIIDVYLKLRNDTLIGSPCMWPSYEEDGLTTILSTLNSASHFLALYWSSSIGDSIHYDQKRELYRSLCTNGLLLPPSNGTSGSIPGLVINKFQSTLMQEGRQLQASLLHAPHYNMVAALSSLSMSLSFLEVALLSSIYKDISVASPLPPPHPPSLFDNAASAGDADDASAGDADDDASALTNAIATLPTASYFASTFTTLCSAWLTSGTSDTAAFSSFIADVDSTLIQPWDIVKLSQLLHVARGCALFCMHRASTTFVDLNSRDHQQKKGPSLSRVHDGNNHSDHTSDAQQEEVLAVLHTLCLQLLKLLPPGVEASALKLMTCILKPEILDIGLGGAKEYAILDDDTAGYLAQFFNIQHSMVGGGGGGDNGRGGGDNEKWNCPNNREDASFLGTVTYPTAQQMSRVLITEYAKSWLGFAPKEELLHQRYGDDDGGDDDTSMVPYDVLLLSKLYYFHLSWDNACVQPEGSLLPMNDEWMIQQSPFSTMLNNPGSLGCALLWMLCLEVGGHSMHSMTQSGPAKKAKEAICFIFDDFVASPSASHISYSNHESSPWMDGVVQCSLLCLLRHYYSQQCFTSSYLASSVAASDSNNDYTSSSAWEMSQARRIAEHFASTSYGNAVFGIAVASLLRCDVSLDIQMEILSVLSDEHALALLPPIVMCPGRREFYLEAPQTKESIDFYLGLLSHAAFMECSSRENGSLVVSIIVHRLARAAFFNKTIKMDEGGEEALHEMRKRKALVCLIMRRLKCQPTILSLFLRWDVDEMCVIDVVSSERLEFIETACAMLEEDEQLKLMGSARNALGV